METNGLTGLQTIERSIFIQDDWEKSRIDFSIGTAHVHIWKANLDRSNSQGDFDKILSDDELLRAKRIIDLEKRNRFLATRFILRNILSNYVALSPEKIQFHYGQNGKPHMNPSGPDTSVFFNISHSEDLLLVAISKSPQIGIDLERIRPVCSKDWIVGTYFSDKDQQFFQPLPVDVKGAAFLSAWTLREAYGKAIGSGLAYAPLLDFFWQAYAEKPLIDWRRIVPLNDVWFISFTPEENFMASAVVFACDKPSTHLLYVNR